MGWNFCVKVVAIMLESIELGVPKINLSLCFSDSFDLVGANFV